MTYIDGILAELNQEAGTTRKLLERIPEDKLSYQPHAKAMTLAQLAQHVATIPAGISTMVLRDSIEMPNFQQAPGESAAKILEAHDQGLAAANANLQQLDDEKLAGSFSITKDGATVMTMPRTAVVRSILLNHYYHHRGQLSTYLRALDVPLPVIYGRSADAGLGA